MARIKKISFTASLVFYILIIGFFLRIYRVNDVLGFYYDQGRDALVIWDFLYEGKLFLIGPTTGIAGIFRGPFYYYLIAPFYFLGGGDPIWPAIFLALLSIASFLPLFYLASLSQSKTTGIFALLIACFSFYIVMASRWLSNPTPMLFLSMCLVWLMYLIVLGRRKAWVGIAFVLGLSLFHFGSSGELFYFPAVGLFAIWQRKKLPDMKIFLISLFSFFVSFVPLILFDIRHDGILRNNIYKFFVEEKSFRGLTSYIFETRSKFLFDAFFNKIFHWRKTYENLSIVVISLYFFLNLKEFWKNQILRICIILLSFAIAGFYFFQGNYGNVYDYYLTGYYLIFILLFSFVIGHIWKKSIPGKAFVLVFFYLFFVNNVPVIWSKINDQVDGPQSVALKNEMQAVSWVYKDSALRDGGKFNLDIYVPPVIPYAYDYLFRWCPKSSRCVGDDRIGVLIKERTNLLYTIYEVDPPHPERLEAWLERQESVGVVEEEVRFGGITVQRRTRYN